MTKRFWKKSPNQSRNDDESRITSRGQCPIYLYRLELLVLKRSSRAPKSAIQNPTQPSVASSPDPSDVDSPLPRKSRGQPSRRRGRGGRPSGGAAATGGDNRRGQTRPYCTQKCVLGLVHEEALDPNCPNILSHRNGKHHKNYHPVDRKILLGLLRNPLGKDLDNDCQDMEAQGSCGALFRVTLRRYRYTLVAKGVTATVVPDVMRDSQIYRRLEPLQGICVPVCLGNIDLVDPYCYSLDVEIVHMMFLAWAGEPVKSSEGEKKCEEVIRSLEEFHHAGVLHEDVRRPNVLWNDEVKRAMLIDFEQSRVFQSSGSILSSVEPIMKRRKVHDKGEGRKDPGTGVPSNPRLVAAFGMELCLARAAFAPPKDRPSLSLSYFYRAFSIPNI
jgi:hypothetical protein